MVETVCNVDSTPVITSTADFVNLSTSTCIGIHWYMQQLTAYNIRMRIMRLGMSAYMYTLYMLSNKNVTAVKAHNYSQVLN